MKKKRGILFFILAFVLLFNLDILAAWLGIKKGNDILDLSMDIPETGIEKEKQSLVLVNNLPSIDLIGKLSFNKDSTTNEVLPGVKETVKDVTPADKPSIQDRKSDSPTPKSSASTGKSSSTSNALDKKKDELLRKIREQSSSNGNTSEDKKIVNENKSTNRQTNDIVQSNFLSTIMFSEFKPASVQFFSDPLPEEDPGYKIVRGINKGTIIPGYLEVGAVSSSTFCPAIVRVTEDVYYDNRVYIPAGSIFFGEAKADYSVRKLFFDLNTLIIGDREVKVKAHLFQKDGNAGFCSEIIDIAKEKRWQSFLLNISAGILNHAKDKKYLRDGYGYIYETEANTPKNTLIEGVQQGVTDLSNRLIEDAYRYNIIIAVNPMEVNIMVDEKIPIDWLVRKF